MQALEIGTRVIVRAVSVVEYNENIRAVRRNSIVPVDAVITGQVIRRLGRYRPATGGGYDGEYNPAELRVTGSVMLWAVRFGILNREQFVQDADLEPGSIRPHTAATYFKMPRRAGRLTYIASPEEPVTIGPGEIKRITFREPIILQ